MNWMWDWIRRGVRGRSRGNRGPFARVDVVYETETPEGTTEKRLPMVIGVMADLTGQPAEPLGPVAKREFHDIDLGNFDDVLEAARPHLKYRVPNLLSGTGCLDIDLAFGSFADFEPAAVCRRVKPLRQLLDERDRLSSAAGPDDQARVREIDTLLSNQLTAILHHDALQRLEGTWRGLHYLVSNTATNEMLKIHVMNISKDDLWGALEGMDTADAQCLMLDRLDRDPFDRALGEPFGCLVGDYYFDHSRRDVEMLGKLSRVAARCPVPFIAGASSRVMGLDSWQLLSSQADIAEAFGAPEYADWRRLRDSEESRHLFLAMPRFLARLPYGIETSPIEQFDFEETIRDADHSNYTWSNAAYLMATNIGRAFSVYGWCYYIRGVESGGAVCNLPCHTFPTDDGGEETSCPTEVGIEERREYELAVSGFMPLLHKTNTNFVAFIGAKSLHKPTKHDDPDATANADLAARLPYLLASCRFAHYLKCIARDHIGSIHPASIESVQEHLESWIQRYVHPDPRRGSDREYRRQPLSSASVELRPLADDAEHGLAILRIGPKYDLGCLRPVPIRVRVQPRDGQPRKPD